MKKLILFWALLFTFTEAFAAGISSFLLPSLTGLVFQSGEDENALWLSLNYLPRMDDPERVKMVISKRGLTFRLEMILTKIDVENYASSIVKRAEGIERIRLGELPYAPKKGKSVSTPFEILDEKKYEKYQKTMKEDFFTTVGSGFEQNLKLLQKFYGKNIFFDGEKIILNMVYPVSVGKSEWKNFAWVNVAPSAGTYKAHTVENRRTFYSPEETHIFAGFPAFWFDGQVGFHGPIAFSTQTKLVQGFDLPQSDRPKKDVLKRWQLLRAPVSHNCIRMEHTNEVRQMLPKSEDDVKKVSIIVTDDYDVISYPNFGTKIVGVKYYWFTTIREDEKNWKKTFYPKGVPGYLLEFPYESPNLAQLNPLEGDNGKINTDMTADNLMGL